MQGLPVKEMAETLRKNKESFKGSQYDELNKKCQEIYVPPGVIKTTPTVYGKEVKVSNEIRLAQPSDKIQLRKKKEERTYNTLQSK